MNLFESYAPAYVYLVISVIAVVAMMFQNAGNSNKYCGTYSCQVPSTAGVFIAKGLYIAFWTFALKCTLQGWIQAIFCLYTYLLSCFCDYRSGPLDRC